MKTLRLIVLFLTLSMVLTTLPISAIEPISASSPTESSHWLLPAINPSPKFPDVEGTWCEDAVDVAYQVGLMEGQSTEFFDIRSPLTYAHITVITARFHELLNGGDGILPQPADGQAWYQPAVDYLTANCDDSMLQTMLWYFQLDSRRPNSLCIRRDFVWMLAAILPESTLPPINHVSGIPDSVSDHILEFYQAGILNGIDEYGTFLEESPLTRGAACAILARIIDPAQRLMVSLRSLDLCRDILGVDPGTVLITTESGSVTAELFAWQLCAALYGQAGQGEAAIQDAIRSWCYYDAPFHLLAERKSVTLPAEKLAEAAQNANARDGYQAMSAAYWQRQLESSALNTVLLDTYSAAEPKAGRQLCAADLTAISEALVQSATASDALTSLDFAAIWQRLMASPWTAWVRLSP